jgi:hypothetical protein
MVSVFPEDAEDSKNKQPTTAPSVDIDD